jgi:hypothetical protein
MPTPEHRGTSRRSDVAERGFKEIRAARAQGTATPWSDADIDFLLGLIDRMADGLAACLEQLLADFYTPKEAWLWLTSPQIMLEGKTPVSLITAGEFR